MSEPSGDDLKTRVRNYWNQQSCDTQVAKTAKFSREYFEEIESFRYFDQPFIHSFAQFSRYRDKRVLEVGFGAGTDFIQWLRCGAIATGVDLTPEALANLQHRIEAYQLPQPESIQVADAENLPFADGTFDLGYSFGVLHHSPDTEKALWELVRVVRPGGEIKVMLYNRHSVYIFNRWIRYALLRGRPWKQLRWVLWHHMESLGTKGYTRKELLRMCAALPVESLHLDTEITAADYLSASALPPLNWLYRLALRGSGCHYGWHPSQYTARVNDPDRPSTVPAGTRRDPRQPLLTGCRWGFFHCLSARKATGAGRN